MKKLIAFLVITVLACSLCACALTKQDVEKTLTDNGYKVDYLGSEFAQAFEADEDEVEFIILARSKDNTHTFYVIGLNDKDAAKELYQKHSGKTFENYAAKRKGKVVIFGDVDGVNLF